jgi:putative DNA primase/helicase
MSAAEIVKALSGRRSGGGWICRCPVLGHGKGRGDQNPSLSVGDGDDGRLLLNCKAGCGFEEILGELKRRGLVDGRPSQGPTRMIRGSAPAVHEPDATALGLWQTAKHAEDPGSYAVREYLARELCGILGDEVIRRRGGLPALG